MDATTEYSNEPGQADTPDGCGLASFCASRRPQIDELLRDNQSLTVRIRLLNAEIARLRRNLGIDRPVETAQLLDNPKHAI